MLKISGVRAVRKLRKLRINQSWAEKRKTSGTGTGRKLKQLRVKQSLAEKYKKFEEVYEWKKAFCYSPHANRTVPTDDEVLVAGFGRKEGDIPGVRFKVLKVSGVSFPQGLQGFRC